MKQLDMFGLIIASLFQIAVIIGLSVLITWLIITFIGFW